MHKGQSEDLQNVRQVLRRDLNSRDKIQAVNSDAILIIRYPALNTRKREGKN